MSQGAHLEAISLLTKLEMISELAACGIQLMAKKARTKEKVLEAVADIPEEHFAQVYARALTKSTSQTQTILERKRRNYDAQNIRRTEKRQKLNISKTTEDAFLTLPKTSDIDHCHSAFLTATSNSALKTEVCASCA
jgi:hypothetical protein